MSLQIVHPDPGQIVDCQMKDSATIYVGSLVSIDQSAPTEGIEIMPVAAGASNTTNRDVPLGVVIGTNLATPLYSSTYLTEYITDASPHDTTADLQGVEGPFAKGDKTHMCKVQLIDPTTVLRAPIRNAAIATAPTVVTATNTSTDGLGITTGATDVAPVAVWSTIYCRSGANAGAYRVIDTTSTTVHAWDKAMVSDIAIGDTFVIAVGLRPVGPSKAYISAEGDYIDCAAALTTNYLFIDVVRLDLSVAGDEYVEFRFNIDNFCATAIA